MDCSVDETEALADLMHLVLSEDEEDTILDKKPSLKCDKCRKQYRHNSSYDRHTSLCTGPVLRRKLGKECAASQNKDWFIKVCQEAEVKSTECLLNALTSVTTDPLMTMLKGTPGFKIWQLAVNFLASDGALQSVGGVSKRITLLVCESFKYMPEKNLTGFGPLRQIQQFMKARMDPTLLDMWKQCLHNLSAAQWDMTCANNLLQSLICRMRNDIEQKLNKAKPSSPVVYDSNINTEEKRMVYSAAGYTLRRLTKKYNMWPNNKAAVLYLEVMSTWHEYMDNGTLDPFRDDDRKWAANLILFTFVMEVEKASQSILNPDNIDQLKDCETVVSVLSDLKASPTICEAWGRLIDCGLPSEELSEGLLDDILKCWISTKANQTFKSYLSARKRKRESW